MVESLSEDQLMWQPHPAATSIAFNVWHLARWADHVQSRLPQSTIVLGQRLEARPEVWHAENLAALWGFDSAYLGDVEAGNELGVSAAQIHFPSHALLLAYLRQCYTLEEQAFTAIDADDWQAFGTPESHQMWCDD